MVVNEKNDMRWQEMSDLALVRQIGRFVRHGRQRQRWTQDLLAEKAGLSRSTVSLLERGESVQLTSMLRVLRVLKLLYVMDVFVVTETPSPLAIARSQRSERKRIRVNKAGPKDSAAKEQQ